MPWGTVTGCKSLLSTVCDTGLLMSINRKLYLVINKSERYSGDLVFFSLPEMKRCYDFLEHFEDINKYGSFYCNSIQYFIRVIERNFSRTTVMGLTCNYNGNIVSPYIGLKPDTKPDMLCTMSVGQLMENDYSLLKRWYFGKRDKSYYYLEFDGNYVQMHGVSGTKLFGNGRGTYYNAVGTNEKGMCVKFKEPKCCRLNPALLLKSMFCIKYVQKNKSLCPAYCSDGIKRAEKMVNKEVSETNALNRYALNKGYGQFGKYKYCVAIMDILMTYDESMRHKYINYLTSEMLLYGGSTTLKNAFSYQLTEFTNGGNHMDIAKILRIMFLRNTGFYTDCFLPTVNDMSSMKRNVSSYASKFMFDLLKNYIQHFELNVFADSTSSNGVYYNVRFKTEEDYKQMKHKLDKTLCKWYSWQDTGVCAMQIRVKSEFFAPLALSLAGDIQYLLQNYCQGILETTGKYIKYSNPKNLASSFITDFGGQSKLRSLFNFCTSLRYYKLNPEISTDVNVYTSKKIFMYYTCHSCTRWKNEDDSSYCSSCFVHYNVFRHSSQDGYVVTSQYIEPFEQTMAVLNKLKKPSNSLFNAVMERIV